MEISLEVVVNLVCSLLILAIVAYFYLPRTKKSGVGGNEKERAAAAPAPEASPAEQAPPSPSRRPDTVSPGASAARAAVTKASMAPPSNEQYRGRVKRYSDRNGMGFISCGALNDRYGGDVRVYREEYDLAGLRVGDDVQFRTILGGRPNCPQGKPWATELKRLDGPPPDDSSGSEDQELRRRSRPAGGGPGEPQQESVAWAPASDRPSAEHLEKLRLARALAAEVAASRPAAPSPGGLKADAPEFVPGLLSGAQGGGNRLSASAAEFVPGGFDAAAAEVVPGGWEEPTSQEWFGAAAEEPTSQDW